MAKKNRKSIQAVRAEIEAAHPITPEPKVITKNVLPQNSAEAEMILTKARNLQQFKNNVHNAPKSIPTTHTSAVQKTIGAPKKISMAAEIDTVILAGGTWEELIQKADEITARRNNATKYTKGVLKAHIKYRINHDNVKIFKNLQISDTGITAIE
jgi:hypothetical protein